MPSDLPTRTRAGTVAYLLVGVALLAVFHFGHDPLLTATAEYADASPTVQGLLLALLLFSYGGCGALLIVLGLFGQPSPRGGLRTL